MNNRTRHSRCSIKKGALKNFAIFTGKPLCWSLFLVKLVAFRSAALFKRDSNTGAFLSILHNFQKHLTQQTFKRQFNVAFRVIWRRNIVQRQINVETTSMLKFITLNNVVYFNVDLNNIRQCRNNDVIFNVDFHNVEQRRNNFVNMTIWKK